MQKMASKTLSIMLLLLAMTSGQALSQGAGGQSSAQERACIRDVQKFCKDAVSNNDLVLQCLQAHGDQLRPACHKVLVDNHKL